MKEYTPNAVVSDSIESNLVPVFLGTIGDTPAYVCDARTLHEFLGNGENFATWIKDRIEKYGFEENLDFMIALEFSKAKRGGHNRKDYHLSLDMAKELSMVENNMKGREARRYFIECERRALAAAGQVVPASHTTTLIPSEQQTLSEIVHRKAESVPTELIGKALAEIWSRIHHKFRVSKYENLPRTQLSDAILYVTAMELRTGKKAIPKEEPPKALPLEIHYPLESAAPPVGCSGLSYYVFSQADGWIDPAWEMLLKLRSAGFNVDGPIYSHQAKLHIMAAMYNAIIDKAVESLNGACAKLPYAPVYLR